ncbi:phage/plasmid primase, P4 family, partial [Paenibacillus whitsoniae]
MQDNYIQNSNTHEQRKAAALWFAQQGYPVIPLSPANLAGDSPGKRPMITGWSKRTSTTPKEVADWFNWWPSCNIGLVLGSASGFVGIDVDGEGGEQLLADWSGGALPETWEFTTGSGRRLLYKIPEGLTLRKLSQSVDGGNHQECSLLGEGCQTVIPPSIHATGKVYWWKDNCSPETIDCAYAPEWLIRKMTSRTVPSSQKSVKPVNDALGKLTEGCAKFSESWQVQQETGLSNDDWFLWVSLLVRAGQTEAALAFSEASVKHDEQSEARIRLLEKNEEQAGPTRCATFGCGPEQIERCHGVKLHDTDGNAANSPAALLKPDQAGKARQLAQEAVARLEAGDHGAHLEKQALQAFLTLKDRFPADYGRLEQRIRSAKAPLRTFQQALKEFKRIHTYTQAGGDSLLEKGFYINDSGRPDGMNENKYARYVLTQLQLGVAEGERFYLYDKGIWNQLSGLNVKRKLRDFLHDLVPDFWTEKLEEQYIGALLREAECLGKLDEQRDYINLQNGMLSLNSFELLQHDRSYHSSIQLPISYTPEAECPTFLKFLDEVFQGDQELVNIVQEMFGYCLTAETRAEKAFILYGQGSNGKSVLLSVLKALCGKGNTSSVPLTELENPFTRHEIVGKILNLAAENEVDNKGLNTQYFKAIVSGDPINVDVKHGKGFMYEPICKLVFATNRLPYSRDKSHAFPRRLIILPFRARFNADSADKHLREKLEAELPGILNFALKGLKRLRAQNYVFSPSQAAKQVLDEYRETINPILSFVSECIKPVSGAGNIFRKQLREEFNRWCQVNRHTGVSEISERRFWQEFRNVLDEERINYKETKSNGHDCFSGITLKKRRKGNPEQSSTMPQLF